MKQSARAGAVALALLALTTLVPATFAQDAVSGQMGPRAAPTAHVDVQQLPVLDTTPPFDVAQTTNKYLARVNGAAREKSDSYFEGGYALQLVDLLYALAVAGLLLWLGISTRIRDWAQDRTHWRTYQVMIYAVAYSVIVAVATFPLALYEGFFREHAYGLSNQSFLAWLGDHGIGLGVGMVAALIFLPILYAAIRAARENWWLWGAGIAIAFQIIGVVIYPVFIAPLTNHYTPLPETPLKQEILSLARANDIPAENVWVSDASRQSNRISANVSGFLGTTRITLNDNLLKQGTHDEVLAILGHEMGHYAMGHTTRLILLLGLITIIGFAFVHWGFRIGVDVFGGQWQVRRVDNIAGLPLLAALATLFFFLATPVTNSIVRTTEAQADLFGVNAVRKPDAFATAILKLSTYRKLDPGRWEEVIFYDHPSGRARIAAMMRWKKEHIRDVDIRDTAKLP